MARARANGQGSVSLRRDETGAATGAEVRVSVSGKRHKRIVARERRGERWETEGQLRKRAEQVLAALHAELARPEGERKRETIRHYAEGEYLPSVEQAGRTRSTRENYANVLGLYVFPHVGAVELGQLTPKHVNDLDRALWAKGRAVSTRRAARAALSRVLEHAIRNERLDRNVVKRAEKLPDAPGEVREVLEPHELRALLATAKGSEWEAPVAVLVFCGLRRGEVLGLSWSALDLEARTLRVAHNLVPVSDGLVLGPPKTKRSRRTLTDLDPALIAVLRAERARQAEHRLRAGELWADDTTDHEGRPCSLVFTTSAGAPIAPHALTGAVKRLARAAGIERSGERVTGPHALRHAWVSHRLAAGDPVPAVSADAGHSSPQITMVTYAHVIAHNRPAATSAMAEAVGAW